MAEDMLRLKILSMGEGSVGKTSLIRRIKEGHFSEFYDPTIEDVYRKQIVVDNKTTLPEFIDPSGQEEFIFEDQIRQANGFSLVYSITSRSSFDQIQDKYLEILLRCLDTDTSKIPVVLIGNKSDLENQRAVSRELGEDLAKRYNVPFFETSAKNDVNVTESLHALIREIRRQADERRNTAVTANKGKKGQCKLS